MSASQKKLSTDQIHKLYKKYLAIIKLETSIFGLKPTEVRHLMGRLGEFRCALEVGGTLAPVANQHGFDVLSKSGKKISVKTTAQKTGFIAISSATSNKADELMILQFMDSKLSIVYYDKMSKACKDAKYWPDVKRYNLGIAKARKLNTYKAS